MKDFVDSPQLTGELTLGRHPDASIESTPVHKYVLAPSRGASFHGVMYIGGQTGLPRRDVGESPRGPLTRDYDDYGAKISIALPSC